MKILSVHETDYVKWFRLKTICTIFTGAFGRSGFFNLTVTGG